MAEPSQPNDTDEARGRRAQAPREIPLRGWRDVAVRTYREVGRDDLALVAAGVAFYSLLAIIPAVFAAVAIYGLFADPAEVQRQLASLAGVLPNQARELLLEQLTHAIDRSPGALSFGAVFGVLASLWSANKGTKALIRAINIAYDENDTRSFVRSNALSLLLTVGGVVTAVICIAAIAVVPVLLGRLGFSETVQTLVSLARWPLLIGLFVGGLSVVYRVAPYRDDPRWRWVTWGTAVATVLWVALSLAFSLYAGRFGSYGETYGSLGAVVVLMLWLWLSAFVVLLGAEINSELEHQTCEDTTQGEPSPMGERGAYVADTVGEAT